MRTIAGLVALGLLGCFAPDTVTCEDGTVCPADTTCRDVTDPGEPICARPDQIEACNDKTAHQVCQVGEISGRCYDGVCRKPGSEHE